MSFQVIGTGSAAPACVKTNDDLSEFLETSDEWIRTRTGIRERRICTSETMSDLTEHAAKLALENAGIDAKELDLILCTTVRGDYMTPSQACVIQKRIGATCPAFDLNAACSGFLYALDVAESYFFCKKVKKVLVVSSEVMSKLVNWTDRSTCVLFGDGAGAAVLGEGDDMLSLRLTADGNWDALRIPQVNGNCPFGEEQGEPPYLSMNGQDVYKFAVTNMAADLTYVIEKAGLTTADVDYVLPHQANTRIIDAAAHRLSIPKEKYVISIDRYGNTSSASIPVMLDELNRGGRLKKGDNLAMGAFGGGVTSGAGVLRWSK